MEELINLLAGLLFFGAIGAFIVYIRGIPLALLQDEADRAQKQIDEVDQLLKKMQHKHYRKP
jgi:hypothetical protein